MAVRVGVSGWSYDEWNDGLYRDVPRARRLERYAEVFPTVEINYTFRRLLSEPATRKWAEQTPAGFRFAVKAHQAITHRQLLHPRGDLLGRFLEALRPLGTRLGPVLFQLPPSTEPDLSALEELLTALPSRLQAAFEFRHPGWFQDSVIELLARYHAALVAAEDEERRPVLEVTAPFVYVRLRKPSYDEEELAEWAERLRSLAVEEAWVYLKHAYHAPAHARRLGELLG